MIRTIRPFMLALALCAYQGTHAQITPPSPFDAFVRSSAIEWASYISDTVHFTQQNLPGLLIHQFEQDRIDLYSLFNPSGVLRKTSKTELGNYYRQLTDYPLFNVSGKIDTMYKTAAGANIRLDEWSSDALYANQVLYVEKGKLKAFIPYVSPLISFYTTANKLIGTGEFFSTALQKKRYKKSTSAQLMQRSSKTYYLDSMARPSTLKEMYGRNLLETIWPYILQHKMPIVSPLKGEPINLVNNAPDLPGIYISTPRYNEQGELTNTQKVYGTFQPSLIKKIMLEEDWYYDAKKNRVFAIPVSMTVMYSEAYAASGMDNKPMFKIIF